jgi:hypothetical protein
MSSSSTPSSPPPAKRYCPLLIAQEPGTRLDELKAYYTFYGYQIKDEGAFRTLMGVALEEIRKAEPVLSRLIGLEEKFRRDQKEATFQSAKDAYKATRKAIELPCLSHTHPHRYYLLSRVVTPLIVANERVVESLLASCDGQAKIQDLGAGECEQTQARLEKLRLHEDPSEQLELSLQRKPSKSAYIRGSYMEMQKLRTASSDVFSYGALKTIFSYIDQESLQFPSLQHLVVGHFAVVVFEVILIHNLFRFVRLS